MRTSTSGSRETEHRIIQKKSANEFSQKAMNLSGCNSGRNFYGYFYFVWCNGY